MQPISAVIPNRDGADLLRQTLPPLRRELPPREYEILVIDDASQDDSVEMLGREFPDVRVIALDQNVGFGAASNRGFEEARNEIVLLLNSDMEVTPGSIELLVEHFAESDVFAAGPRYAKPGEPVGPLDDGLGLIRPQLGAPGGGGLLSRRKFLELGGFDPLYYPFYWEDIDLGWSAWRHGWRIIRDARACFVHLGAATIGALYTPAYVERVKTRNRCLLGWKNFRSARLLARHAGSVARKVLGGLLRRRRFAEVLGVMDAVAALPRALRARRSVSSGLSDAEIMRQAGVTSRRESTV